MSVLRSFLPRLFGTNRLEAARLGAGRYGKAAGGEGRGQRLSDRK
jgi:hypothetical protein